MKIVEAKDGVYIDGVKQTHVTDIQPKENLHSHVKVQVTYLVEEFVKEDFNLATLTSASSQP